MTFPLTPLPSTKILSGSLPPETLLLTIAPDVSRIVSFPSEPAIAPTSALFSEIGVVAFIAVNDDTAIDEPRENSDRVVAF